MPVARLTNRAHSLAKAFTSGGGAAFSAPEAWMTTSYGSGWPIQPVTAPQDVELPRVIDYPISVNATLTPRTGYGLMPFAALLEAYENVTEVRTPVELIHRELGAFLPHLVDDEGNEVPDHPYAWMCKTPDGETPFATWATHLLKCAKVYDAPAVYLSGEPGNTTGLHFLDGSTLFIIVDQYGKIPSPEPILDYVARQASGSAPTTTAKATPTGWPMGPSTLDAFVQRLIDRHKAGADIPTKIPAYTQIIKGTPYSWWSADQIWYMPKSPRMNSPYGESFIEIAWPWIMVIVNITAFELGHYRTGSMPEGFVTMPRDDYGDSNQLLALELMYNARMSSNPATERMRLRFFPDGAKYIPTKKPDFPDKLYTQAWKNILHAIGVPPSEFGDIPGSGLGGKGFKEGQMSDLSRNTLNPSRELVAQPFNHVLQRDGVDDVHFELAYPMDEMDPDKQRESVYQGMIHGTLSLNDALGELNYDAVGDPDDPSNIANKHLIVAGSAIYVVEDMTTQGGMAVPTFTGKPGGDTGGEPVGPETDAKKQGLTHTPDDMKTVEKLIANAVRTGKFTTDNKTYFVMPLLGDGLTKEQPPFEFSMLPVSETVQPDENEVANQIHARRIDEAPHFPTDSDSWDHNAGVHQANANYEAGMISEAREHPQLPAHEIEQLVMDHLRIDPDYYGVSDTLQQDSMKAGQASLFNEQELRDKASKLVRPAGLTKHCGVCPDDDAYFDAPISREVHFDFPNGVHANTVEIVAMAPPDLPPKAALWKPEGGEVEALQDFIGGPQYPREEAAYLLDRALGFYLIPVAYVTESHSEVGAAVYFTFDATPPHQDMKDYAPHWTVRAAVLDYIMSQQDRGPNHNYLTHPDDDTRPILIDNGLGFPVNPEMYCVSPFCALWVNVALPSDVLAAIARLMGDAATWHDIEALVGSEAANKAKVCAQRLLDNKMVTHYTDADNEGTPEGATPLTEGSSGL